MTSKCNVNLNRLLSVHRHFLENLYIVLMKIEPLRMHKVLLIFIQKRTHLNVIHLEHHSIVIRAITASTTGTNALDSRAAPLQRSVVQIHVVPVTPLSLVSAHSSDPATCKQVLATTLTNNVLYCNTKKQLIKTVTVCSSLISKQNNWYICLSPNWIFYMLTRNSISFALGLHAGLTAVLNSDTVGVKFIVAIVGPRVWALITFYGVYRIWNVEQTCNNFWFDLFTMNVLF